jgi:hypothetical protein
MTTWDAPEEMYLYKETPSLSNAKLFLVSLGVPMIKTSTRPNKSILKKRKRTSGGTFFDDSFAYVDLLHDLYDSTALPDHLVKWILSLTTLTQIVKGKILKACTTSSNSITSFLAKEFFKAPTPFFIEKGEKHFDVETTNQFYKFINDLADKYNGRVLPIVLDGLYKSFDKKVEDSEAAKSLALCAFVHVLFANVNPVSFKRKIKRSGNMELRILGDEKDVQPCVSSICFLTGNFQTLDIPEYDVFLRQLTKELSADVKWIKNPVTIKHMKCLYPGLSERALKLPSGVKVPLEGKIFHGFNTLNKTNHAIAMFLQTHFCVYYTKNELRTLMNYLCLLNTNEQPFFTQFVQTIASVNLFKDAFRADVAIENDAIFVTNDRMAQVYYCKKNKKQNLPSLLFTYFPDCIVCGVAL